MSILIHQGLRLEHGCYSIVLEQGYKTWTQGDALVGKRVAGRGARKKGVPPPLIQ